MSYEVLQMPFGWCERREQDRIVASYGHPMPETFSQVSEIGDRSFRRNEAALNGTWISSDRVPHLERGALSNLRKEFCESRQVTRLKDKAVYIVLCQRNLVRHSIARIDGLTASNSKPVHESCPVEGM